MTDPAKVYARKYADLEAERDRYRDALEHILAEDAQIPCTFCAATEIVREALNDASREGGPLAPVDPQQLRIDA